MRTLLSLLNQPFSHAVFATQLAATWTNNSIFNFSKTDKTFENFIKVCASWRFLFFSLLDMLMPQNIRFNNSACVSTLNCSYICNSMWVSSWPSANSWYNSTNWITHWTWNNIVVVINIILNRIRLVYISLICCKSIKLSQRISTSNS